METLIGLVRRCERDCTNDVLLCLNVARLVGAAVGEAEAEETGGGGGGLFLEASLELLETLASNVDENEERGARCRFNVELIGELLAR